MQLNSIGESMAAITIVSRSFRYCLSTFRIFFRKLAQNTPYYKDGNKVLFKTGVTKAALVKSPVLSYMHKQLHFFISLVSDYRSFETYESEVRQSSPTILAKFHSAIFF